MRRGDGSARDAAETLKQWHKVTLTLDGPFAHETDTDPNPFTDYRLDGHLHARVRHAGVHRARLLRRRRQRRRNLRRVRHQMARAPCRRTRPGKWNYTVSLHERQGRGASTRPRRRVAGAVRRQDRHVRRSAPTDKTGRDFRAKGRLQYVGKHHLRFAGTGEYFLKAGADAPETLLAYADFDGTVARKPDKVPLKTWQPHVRDWKPGDPTWKGGKGKGLIGALNYLSGKGCNAFSFLTYNAGGDGDNVWPFVERDDKLHYDCSKLDQWGIVFDHAHGAGPVSALQDCRRPRTTTTAAATRPATGRSRRRSTAATSARSASSTAAN